MSHTVLDSVAMAYQPVWNRRRLLAAVRLSVSPVQPGAVDAAQGHAPGAARDALDVVIAASAIQRFARHGCHQLDRGLDSQCISRDLGLVALLRLVRIRRRIGAGGKLDVLGNVDNDRAGAAIRSDVERLMDRPRQLVHVGDEIIVLGAGARDAGRIGFLEANVAVALHRADTAAETRALLGRLLKA